ncbi:MAG: DUF748 domain-containing protein [Bacteroidetes bacterium]|nr:DUF748 domain-containing protein [Bacteroidota bacterium]
MKKKYIVLISIVVLLVVIRLILPYVLLHYANKSLGEMKGYYGHIEDIDLSLYRGAYIIKSMHMDKIDTVLKKETKFFNSEKIDVSVEWSALFKGSIVAEIVLKSPVLIFTKNKVELEDLQKDSSFFKVLFDDFMPLKVNRFQINNGDIHYADNTTTPRFDLVLKNLNLLALNLTNVTNEKVELPATVTATGSVYKGTLTFNMKMNPMSNQAAFDLNAEVKGTELKLLNNFLKAYGNFDVNKGTFGMYTEMAAKNGKFKGYVKPLITDLDVVGPEDKKDTFFHLTWEAIVGTVAEIFENQKKDQLATKIRIEGNFKNPGTNTGNAVWELLRNAFVHALMPIVDNEINIKSLKKVSAKSK